MIELALQHELYAYISLNRRRRGPLNARDARDNEF